MTKKKWLALIFIGPAAIALFIWLGGELVMYLWNWLTPALFGWRQVTFWQAVGLLALCRILVGGHGIRGGNRSYARQRIRQSMDERWEKMTPEEREKFRQSWRGRCSGFTPSAGEPAAPEAK